MVDVVKKDPPVSQVILAKEDGSRKVINIRKEKKVKVPPVPSGEILKCPHCGGEHQVMVNDRKPPRKSFTCPKIGHPLLYLKKEGQEYLQSLVIRKEMCPPVDVTRSTTPVPAPKSVEVKPLPGTQVAVDLATKKKSQANVLKILQEAVDNANR